MQADNSKKITEITSGIKQICSRQEKCKSEIKDKLKKYNLENEQIDDIIAILEKDKYIDEERYAGYFVKDKLKFNKWGKIKIRYELIKKKLPTDLIDNAIENIYKTEYIDILKSELTKKLKSLHSKSNVKEKLIRYAQSKGFELDEILLVVNELINTLSIKS